MYVFANLLYIHYYHHNLKGIELMSRQKSERRNAVKTRIQSKEDLYYVLCRSSYYLTLQFTISRLVDHEYVE